ncbi:MAG TPA: hypothetical protein VGS96_15610, partial [Thermoanaerobaculia bacterium]|nr:hypothetical protein [Thermoanaerobaculia bacterium]
TRSDSGSAYPLLIRSDDSKYRVAARTIYALGRNRLSEVLTMSAPSRLLSFLVVGTSDKNFRGLSDAAILALFAAEDDRLRKAAALKCVKAMPRKRVTGLLASYMSTPAHRYYNVVHWLDFGISVPRELALRAVEKLLHQEWQV